MADYFWISNESTNFELPENWSTEYPGNGIVTPATPPQSGDAIIFTPDESTGERTWGLAECNLARAINLGWIFIENDFVLNVTASVTVGFNEITSYGTINLSSGAVLQNSSTKNIIAGTVNGGEFRLSVSVHNIKISGQFNCAFNNYTNNTNTVEIYDSFIETYKSSGTALTRFVNVTVKDILFTATSVAQAFSVYDNAFLRIIGTVYIANTYLFNVIIRPGASLNLTGEYDQNITWVTSNTANIFTLDKPSGTVTLNRFAGTLKSKTLRDASEVDPRTVSTAKIVNNDANNTVYLDDICLAEIENNGILNVNAGKTVDVYSYSDGTASQIKSTTAGATLRVNRDAFDGFNGTSTNIAVVYWDSPIIDPPVYVTIVDRSQTSLTLKIESDNPANEARFEIETTATEKTFTLPFALTDLVSVDWGDGSETLELAHTYTNVGNFTIKVATIPRISEFRFATGMTTATIKTGAKLLKRVSEFNLDLSHFTTELQYCFYGCSGLLEFCKEVFESAVNITSLLYAFRGCSSLPSIPEDAFAKNTAVMNFSFCFYLCTTLTSIFTSFDRNTAVTDFSYCFQGCTNITSNVPELWISHSSATKKSCFKDCVNAANYASIPSSWK